MFDVLPRIGICEKILNISQIDYFLLPNLEKKFQSESLDILGCQKIKGFQARIIDTFRDHKLLPQVIRIASKMMRVMKSKIFQYGYQIG